MHWFISTLFTIQSEFFRHFRRLDIHVVDFLSFFDKIDNFCKFPVCFSAHQVPSEIRSVKSKPLLPVAANSFLLQ